RNAVEHERSRRYHRQRREARHSNREYGQHSGQVLPLVRDDERAHDDLEVHHRFDGGYVCPLEPEDEALNPCWGASKKGAIVEAHHVDTLAMMAKVQVPDALEGGVRPAGDEAQDFTCNAGMGVL